MTRRVRAGRRDASDRRYDATRYDVTENSARAALFKGNGRRAWLSGSCNWLVRRDWQDLRTQRFSCQEGYIFSDEQKVLNRDPGPNSRPRVL